MKKTREQVNEGDLNNDLNVVMNEEIHVAREVTTWIRHNKKVNVRGLPF